MDELTAYLLDAFGLGDGPARLTPVARGADGQVSLLQCGADRYAVKQLFAVPRGDRGGPGSEEGDAREAAVRREADYLAQFGRAGIPVPEPVADRGGRFLVPLPSQLGGGVARLSRWVEGVRPGLGQGPRRVAGELGALLGRLHAAAPWSAEPVGPWYRTVPEAGVWTDLVARGVGQVWQPGMAAKGSELERLGDLVRGAQSAATPLVVGHRDLHPDNVLVAPDGGLVPVDWEDVGPMVPDRELVKVLVQWHVDGDRIDEPAIRHTVTAYRRAGGTGEVQGLESFTMLLSGELNFLAKRAAMSLDRRLDDEHLRHAVSEVQGTLSWLPSVVTLARVLDIVQAEAAGS